MFKKLQGDIGMAWCRMMHQSVMWPVHGQYECRICGRRYPAFAEAPVGYRMKRTAIKVAVSLLLVTAVASLSPQIKAANISGAPPSPQAAAALERYIGSGGTNAWPLESVEIHAALPTLSKAGELRAIRRPVLAGGSGYEVIELAGDPIVKEQVIARYLNAQQRVSELSPARLAISPANYRFAYKGVVDDGEYLAYVYQITPRRKRAGLIKGELWLDQRTGVPVRESGYLVKSPSAFIKRVSITRDNAFRDSVMDSRRTHIMVETRLIGRAELVVEEHPLPSAEGVLAVAWDTEGGLE